MAVIGSLNVDRSVTVPRFPRRGETVLGSNLLIDNGGKGANQAVAASRLGASVAMIGCVGDDGDGAELIEALATEGVDVGAVGTAQLPTGAAFIAIDDSGENTIVVAPGANSELTADRVTSGSAQLAEADIVLAQLEVPTEAVREGIRLSSGVFILNPAPVTAGLSEWWRDVDVLVPNRGELSSLSGMATDSMDDVVSAASALNVPLVVVTLGGDGALVVHDGTHSHIEAHSVEAIDSTAAGDSFCGALAVALAEGTTPEEAARFATRCAAWTVSRRGAQGSLPRRSDVE